MARALRGVARGGPSAFCSSVNESWQTIRNSNARWYGKINGVAHPVHASIFARVAGRFISQKELFATEVLSAILDEEPARRAVLDFCRGIADSIPADLDFRPQVSSDSGRPDVVGTADGERVIVIEGKFDAPLTDNQPCAYVDSLREDGLLLFVVSERRVDHIWRQVCARCGIKVADASARQARFRGRHIAITTWNSLLENARAGLQGDPVAEDIPQLLEFARGCDMAAFVPFSTEELSSQRSPAVLLQTIHVAEPALRAAADEGHCKLDALSREPDSYGRYLTVGDTKAWMGYWLTPWALYGVSPLWFQVLGRPVEKGLREAIAARLPEFNPGITSPLHTTGYGIAFPLAMKVNADTQIVIAALVEKLRLIARVCRR